MRAKYWKIIADNLSKAGWILGCVSAVDSKGRKIWITDAHQGDGKRFAVQAEEVLAAFMELESAIRVELGPEIWVYDAIHSALGASGRWHCSVFAS